MINFDTLKYFISLFIFKTSQLDFKTLENKVKSYNYYEYKDKKIAEFATGFGSCRLCDYTITIRDQLRLSDHC